jgi:hypothetical protein
LNRISDPADVIRGRSPGAGPGGPSPAAARKLRPSTRQPGPITAFVAPAAVEEALSLGSHPFAAIIRRELAEAALIT